MTIELWSDLHHNLVTDAQGSIKKAINVDAVKTSIDNILRTRRGERVMLPSFGAGLTDMLFEGIDEDAFDDLGDEIREAIEMWDDRVLINSINFFAVPDRNEVTLKISFGIKGYDKIFEFSTALSGVGG